MGAVVGIDLGTTHTVVGIVQGGQAAAVADEEGHKLIPSVVSFHPNGNVLVGRAAKERRLLDATNTIYSIKRLIGRSWGSEEVRMARARFPFEMREGPGQAALVVARGETYTLPEISAFVLRKAKAVAETAIGGSVDRAVITVPANFNDLQRAATKVAGRVAGLEVLRILNEPTAAALAYGYGKSTAERLAVYDFGGGTFDITLLDLSDNVFEVLATAGNTFLGGDDIDLAIAERMADAFLAQHRYDARENPAAFERLRAAAETLKQRLSFETHASVELREVAHGPGGVALSATFRMTRAELEQLLLPLVARSFDVCREALDMARRQPSDFDQVLLVGGSTRIPLVRSRVEEFFGRPVLGHISPDEVVAIGAAIQAMALTGAERRRADIPEPPNPAARQTGGTFSPQTHPFGRERVPTHGGVPSASRGRTGDPVMPVFMPAGAAGRERRITGSGLGSGTLPGVASPGRPLGGTLPGPGPGRSPDKPLPPAGVDTRTLRSAEEQAALAQSLGASEPADVSKLSADQIAKKYGNLPLILPGSAPQRGPGARPSTDDEPTVPGPEDYGRPRRPRTGTVVLDDRATGAGRREDSVAAFRLDDADLEELPTAEGYDRAEAPAVEEITRRVRTGVRIEDLEDALPVPDIPLDDELTAVGPAPAPRGGLDSPWHARDPAPREPHASGLSGATIGAVTFASALDEPWTGAAPHAAKAPASPAVMPPVPAPPLLVDVTPLTLAVETVNGYCDPVIERNTPVPCERTRAFVTAIDNQTSVKVRVSQGESSRFSENTLLGEVELTGLRAAPRGAVQIAVSFALDTDGILNVSATDVETGRAAATRVRLIGMPEASDIERMAARHAALPL